MEEKIMTDEPLINKTIKKKDLTNVTKTYDGSWLKTEDVRACIRLYNKYVYNEPQFAKDFPNEYKSFLATQPQKPNVEGDWSFEFYVWLFNYCFMDVAE
jgi:hypothetical protein